MVLFEVKYLILLLLLFFHIAFTFQNMTSLDKIEFFGSTPFPILENIQEYSK